MWCDYGFGREKAEAIVSSAPSAKTSTQENKKVEYTTPPRVQAWFLRRSRDNWKAKYMKLKARFKRVQNQVNDVSKSREKWCNETKQLEELFFQLQAENAAMQDKLAALEKVRARKGPGPALK